MVDVNCVYLSIVNVLGNPVGLVTTTPMLAVDPLTEAGVYPKCLAIETADVLLTAESKNISFISILAKNAL